MARTEDVTVEIKIRMKEPLRRAIERSAKQRGISMNAEMVDRLTQSYRNDQSLSAVFDFAYGPETAGMLMILQEVVRRTSSDSMIMVGEKGRGVDWLSQPYAFDQVVRAVHRALDALQPPGDTSPPEKSHLLATKVGEFMAASVLDAVSDPENSILSLGSWAKQVSEKLGSKIVERIRETEPRKTLNDLLSSTPSLDPQPTKSETV
jgi:hypothetical protein